MSVKLGKNDLVIGELQLGKRPAVICVDFSNGFTSADSPLGGNFTAEISANLRLVKIAQEHNIPLFFSTVVYDNEEQASVFRQRLPALNILQRGSNWVDIHNAFSDYVNVDNIVEKHHPSAFFATDLLAKLKAIDVDSVIITGLTTSGCVRATCVDALQHNYLSIVVPEACGDRNSEAHDMSLHDMHAKYARVLPLNELITYLTGNK